jgi:hypothetical protein
LMDRNVSLVEESSKVAADYQQLSQVRIPELEKVIEKFKEKYNGLEVRYVNAKIMLVNAVDDMNSLEMENLRLCKSLGVEPEFTTKDYSSFLQQ